MINRMEDRETQARLRGVILSVVEEQRKELPYVQECFERLAAKYGEDGAKDKIAVLVSEQIYDIMNDRRFFDEEKYKKDLEALD